MFKNLWMAALSLSIPTAATAAITFDLRDPGRTTEIESGLLSISGLTATLTPSAGILNQTSSGFGVNGPGSDDTDALDGTESITISFDQAITFTELTLSRFSTSESATLTLNGFPDVGLTDTGMGVDQFSFTSQNSLAVGETLTLAHVSGNGFSFDSFTVQTTSVPEPSGAALIGIGGIASLLRRRWNRKR